MSCTIHFFAQFNWKEGTPPAVWEWLAALGACDAREHPAVEPPFPVHEIAEGMLDQLPWIVCQPGAMTKADRWGGTVAASMHDDSHPAIYALVFLLAEHCVDGTMAVWWTDMAPDDDPELAFVQDGLVFLGRRNGEPIPTTSDPDPSAWRVTWSEMTPDELSWLAVPNAEALIAETGPAVSRHLFARSVARALDEVGGGDPDRRAAAEAGARAVLDLLEAGGDPAIVQDSPGWQLQEVRRYDRRTEQGGGIPGTGRVISGLAAALDDIGTARPVAVPRRPVEGDVVELLEPTAIRAYGPLIEGEVLPGRFGGMFHEFLLEAPAGTRLTLTRVFEAGHAQCWPVEGDPFAWPRLPDPMLAMTTDPVAPADEYTLGTIFPRDEGVVYRRVT